MRLLCPPPRSQQHILKMDIRLLHPSDIPHVQTTNITNLPENYFCKYYMYHQLSWPQLSYVAVDVGISGLGRSGRAIADYRTRSRDPRRRHTMRRRLLATYSQRWRRILRTASNTVTSHLSVLCALTGDWVLQRSSCAKVVRHGRPPIHHPAPQSTDHP